MKGMVLSGLTIRFGDSVEGFISQPIGFLFGIC
jgi:hypothetical protein